MSRLLLIAAFVLIVVGSIGASTKQVILPRISGERYRAVTPATVPETVCTKGWTATIRPPSAYTSALKRWQLKDLEYADQNPTDFEEDHLIPLSIGGAPYSTRNLFPQPWSQARRDDQLELQWWRDLCAGRKTLRQVQREAVLYKKANG